MGIPLDPAHARNTQKYLVKPRCAVHLSTARSFDDILLNATGQHSYNAPCHMHVHVVTKVIHRT